MKRDTRKGSLAPSIARWLKTFLLPGKIWFQQDGAHRPSDYGFDAKFSVTGWSPKMRNSLKEKVYVNHPQTIQKLKTNIRTEIRRTSYWTPNKWHLFVSWKMEIIWRTSSFLLKYHKLLRAYFLKKAFALKIIWVFFFEIAVVHPSVFYRPPWNYALFVR